MNDADKKAFEVACKDWATKSAGKDLGEYFWQAACEWRDSQVGEPVAWMFKEKSSLCDVQEKVFRSYKPKKEHIDHEVWDICPLYTTPPTAQINHQLVKALELAETEMRYAGWGTPVADNSGLANAYEAVVAALAATQMRGDA